MVSYQAYIAIAFEIAESKGASFNGIEDGGEFMEQLGAYWQENGDEIRQLTHRQTTAKLSEVIEGTTER